MKISIITPSYNQGKFISKCIASIKSQIGIEKEHIILDNCSIDNTSKIIQDYQLNPGDAVVKIFIEHDKGQTNAINHGFQIASGDILCWLNTDEYYHSNTLAIVIDYFKKYPQIDIFFGDFYYVDEQGNPLKKRKAFGFSASMLLYYGCYIPSCSTFIRRKVIDDGHILDESFRVTMDFEYYVRLAKLGYRFGYIPVSLASFTLHETNISVNQKSRRLVERRLVQDRFSGVKGPCWYRTIVYTILWYFWIIFRIIRRTFMK